MGRRGGKARRGRQAREAATARAETLHGHRPDVALKRDAKAERTGKRAALGDGLTPEALREHGERRAAFADGYLVPRMSREERAAWHALAKGFDASGIDGNDNDDTEEGTA